MSFRRDHNDRQNTRYDRERSPDRTYNRQPSSSTHRWDDDDRNSSNSLYAYRQGQRHFDRNPINYPIRERDDFEIIERVNDLELNTKFCSPNGDILVGDFQRRKKDINRDKEKDCSSGVSFEAYNAYITTYCHLIEMQEVKDEDTLIDAIKWLTGIDFTQQDMQLDRQSLSSEQEEGRLNPPSSAMLNNSVVGISLRERREIDERRDFDKSEMTLYLATAKRVVAIQVSNYISFYSWQDFIKVLQRLFASKYLHFQAWRAAEICIKLARHSRLNFRLRDLTFGQRNEYEDLYEKALKCDGIDSNVVSPFFVKRANQYDRNAELVRPFHYESAAEAYRCALIDREGEDANVYLNSSLLHNNINVLYGYVLTLDAQKGEDTESPFTTYQIEFDERKSGQEAGRIDSIPHFDIFCYRDPIISPSQVVHFELEYTHSGKTIYADAYGQCYAKHGKRAYICFPEDLKPRTQGNFTIPSEAPGSSRLRYNEPFKKDNSLTIKRITVIGKPVLSAQQKHDYEWLVNACTEKENFQLHFKDRSGLVPFIYPNIGNLAFKRDEVKELKDKQHLYNRLGVFSDFIHFEAPQKADLNDQQFAALTQIFDSNNIVVAVEGFAGTGKSKVIEQAIIHCKREIMRIPAETWHRIYCDRLPFQQDLDLGNDEEIPSVLIERNEIKPMILVLTRTNASKLHISAKDQDRNSSLILQSNRFSSYDKSNSTCNSTDFATTEKVIRTVKNKVVMYATIGAFHNIAKTFLQVANIQCIIVKESNSVYPLELASLLSMFFLVPRLVLCGDLKQLSPHISVNSAMRNALKLNISPYSDQAKQMFQSFVKHTILDRSYRLPKNMLSLLRNIRYDNLLYDKEGSFVPLEEMNCKKELLFFQYSESDSLRGESSVQGSTSWINPAEADAAVKLLLEIK